MLRIKCAEFHLLFLLVLVIMNHNSRISFEELKAVPDLLDVDGGGVYLFLRRFVPLNQGFPQADDLVSHVVSSCATSLGHERISRVTSHFGYYEQRLHFGTPLPSGYIPLLNDTVSDVAKRKTIANLLRNFPFPPVLYVGETDNFVSRVKEHLQGSDVWDRLRLAGYSFADVDFLPLPLPDSFDPKERIVVERILSHLLMAPFTDKAGWGPRYEHRYQKTRLEEEQEDDRDPERY